MFRILVLNVGGTSFKLNIYEDETCVKETNIGYTEEEIARTVIGKNAVARKKKLVIEWLEENGLTLEDIDAFSALTGAAFYAAEGGIFRIDGDLKKMIEAKFDLNKVLYHPLFETIALINALQEELKKERPIFTVDPATLDQRVPEAKLSGCPHVQRRASCHSINQKACARKAAEELGMKYEEANIIVAHIGSGISIGAHEKGRLVDVNDPRGDTEGPMSPTRAGSVPLGPIIGMCYSGNYTEAEIRKMLRTKCGLVGYLGVSDLRDVEKMIDNGDAKAKLVFDAMAYQISREICACFASLHGKVDAIVFTAGMAKSERLVSQIKSRVGEQYTYFCYPDGLENEALAKAALMVLRGEAVPETYHPEEEYKNIKDY